MWWFWFRTSPPSQASATKSTDSTAPDATAPDVTVTTQPASGGTSTTTTEADKVDEPAQAEEPPTVKEIFTSIFEKDQTDKSNRGLQKILNNLKRMPKAAADKWKAAHPQYFS